jgi:hypothetical protein
MAKLHFPTWRCSNNAVIVVVCLFVRFLCYVFWVMATCVALTRYARSRVRRIGVSLFPFSIAFGGFSYG